MMWMVPLDAIYPVILLFITGHGYFTGIIPASWTEFLTAHNISSLDTMLWWMTGFNAIKVLGCLVAMALKGKPRGTWDCGERQHRRRRRSLRAVRGLSS